WVVCVVVGRGVGWCVTSHPRFHRGARNTLRSARTSSGSAGAPSDIQTHAPRSRVKPERSAASVLAPRETWGGDVVSRGFSMLDVLNRVFSVLGRGFRIVNK